MTPSFKLFLFVLAATASVAAQTCDGSKEYDSWLDCHIKELANQRVQSRMKQVATEKQSQSPSAASSSTSLLDRTSAADLFGAAVRLLGAGNQNKGNSGDFTATASTYALYSAIRGLNPMNPETYDAGRNSRRFSVTVGEQAPQDQNNALAGKDRIAGVKILIFDGRDVSRVQNKQQIASLLPGAATAGRFFSAADAQVRRLLYAHFAPSLGLPPSPNPADTVNFENTHFSEPQWVPTLKELSTEERAAIDQLLIDSGVVDKVAALTDAIKKAIETIRKRPQFSIAYTARLSEGTGPDLHRGQAIMDWGFSGSGNLTVNAGFDYLNSPKIGADVRSGRVSAEGQFELNHDQALRLGIQPYLLAIAGEGKWNNSPDPIYRVQVRFEIPLAKGIVLPLSFTHANRTELIKEAENKGQFGFTIDIAKLAGLFVSGK